MRRLSECISNSVSKPIGDMMHLAVVWRAIVGKQNAEISVPVRFNSGKLTVAVFDNIFIQGLTFIKEDIIEKFEENKFIVEDIIFVFKPKYIRPERKIVKRKITDQEYGFISRLSAQIDNLAIREGYRRALESYFGVYSLEEFLMIEKEKK